MRIIKLAAFAVLSLAVPAHAADLATIDCVIEKLQPTLKELIDAEVTRSFAEGATRANFDPAVHSGLRVAATNCAIEHKWSEAAATAARDYALGKLGLPIAEKFVAGKGFEVAELETQFGALPEEVRNRPLTKEEMQALVIASVTDEEKKTRENAALLNNYYLMLSTVQYAAWNFSQA
ncbi:MAG: hypothetical protein EOP61_11435 [Sphingomonadales bacterium]|nr:MAG: hypothetical protein EOP61_11435 [Sphingomonadales bacterium]